MENLGQLFDYRLQNIYTAEYDLLDVLEELAQDCSEASLRRTFVEQRNQVMRHIKRLERIFKIRGRQPNELRNPELEGIVRMKRTFADERPTPSIRDYFNLEVAQKIQYFQIGSYESLARLATRMDMAAVAKLLRDTLDEEKQAMYELNLLVPKAAGAKPLATNGRRSA